MALQTSTTVLLCQGAGYIRMAAKADSSVGLPGVTPRVISSESSTRRADSQGGLSMIIPAAERMARHMGSMGRAVQTGSFINSVFGEAGSTLANAQMFLIRFTMIWPLKAVAPAAYSYWLWQFLNLLRNRKPAPLQRPSGVLPLMRFTAAWGLRELLRLWAAVEAIFYLYYRFKHWQLENRAASAPLMPPGKPMEALRRALETVKMIQVGGKIVNPDLSLARTASRMALAGRHAPGTPKSPGISPKSSVQDLQFLLQPQDDVVESGGVERLLRDWNDSRSALASAVSTEDSTTLTKGLCADDMATMERIGDDAEVLALKQAEASGWFLKRHNHSEKWPLARLRELKRGNVYEWVAWAFFNCSVEEVPSARCNEAEELTGEIIDWMDVRLRPGYNPDVVPMRLTMDPIPSAHRPLIYYAVTQAIFSQIINIQLHTLSFRHCWSGTLSYWHRPGAPTKETGCVDPNAEPIVFCHGIGVNVLPYRPLLNEMLQRAPERSFFLISLPHISMRIKEEVPSSTEMVACLSDMLGSWGHTSAHFVGHSFGSLPLAWMARKAPSFVSMMTFIDPVCFLLVKPDVCYNFMYRKPENPTQLLINYFLAKELYIAHSLSRNFFWHQNQLWPEEFPCPTLVVLSGRDSIVPAHSVRRYLTCYKQHHKLESLKVLWFPELGHGEINFGPVGEKACARITADMFQLEAEHAKPSGQAAK